MKWTKKLVEAIAGLIKSSAGEVIKVPAPDDKLIDEYEAQIGIDFGEDYRFFKERKHYIFRKY